MEFISQNWFIIVILIAAVGVIGYGINSFISLPTEAQLAQVKEWLLWAVAEAEKKLGGGTGQLKLRYVYGMFITKFPYLADIIPFECFSELVDEVLETFREMINTNVSVANYIKSEEIKEVE